MSQPLAHRVAMASVVLVGLALAATQVSAQEVIELSLDDRPVNADFPVVHRIGDGAREWELLTRVTSIGFDAQGNLHIGDLAGGELSVLVVGANGELVVRFGQPGEGPGDFRNATHALALPDGRTVVSDDGHMAYQLFDLEGILERWARYPGVTQGEAPPMMFVRSADPRLRKVDRWDGSLVARVTFARTFRVDSTTSPPTFNLKIGTGPRTVLRVHLDGDQAREEEVAQASNPGAEGEFFFGALPSGRVAFSDTTVYAFKIAEPTGRTERVLVRPFPARMWDARTVGAFKDYIREGFEAAVAAGPDRAESIGLVAYVALAEFDVPTVVVRRVPEGIR